MSLEEQQQLENEYVMQTFARKPVQLVSGSGMVLKDSTGKEYLDFLAGIGVCSLGHCHPVLQNALKEQIEKLIHVGNYYYIEKRGELSQTISNLLNSSSNVESSKEEHSVENWKTFYANSGAEANECAIKLARLYAQRYTEKVSAKGTSENSKARETKNAAKAQNQSTECVAYPYKIVVLDNSFHGRTLATLAATAQGAKQNAFKPLPEGFISTPINNVHALKEVFQQYEGQICAVMTECIQGESGVHPLTSEFMQAIRNLTHENNALMICDEVQTGIYRCGVPFAFQHYGVMPDVVTMAKGIASGMPMGACAAKAHVANAFEPGLHGTTFGGSNLAIAAADATLGELQKSYYAKHVQEMGEFLRSELAKLPHVENVRGLGLMCAADLQCGISAPSIVEQALGCGLLLNATGPSTLRFLPPLICEKQHIETMCARLKTLLEGQA